MPQTIDCITPNWPAPSCIKSFTSTRTGGYSQSSYGSFNLAHHVGDDPENVAKNHDLLAKTLHLPSEPIWLNQVHKTHVIAADQEPPGIEADAAYTEQRQVICVVLTADCIPILLCNKEGTEVAAIHAGWRGLAKGIITKTIQAMNSPTEYLMAWLGPGISADAYIVDDTVHDAFINNDKTVAKAFISKEGDKWSADLYSIARQHLQNCGVHSIYGGHFCTYTDHERFYSYRRDGQTGRMASLVWIE